MAGPGARRGIALRNSRIRVVLSSPHPVSECLRRLAEVTTWRTVPDFYLHEWELGRPDPRFRGEADQWRVRLRKFTRGNPAWPVLNARPEAAADGETTLSGQVGGDKDTAVAVSLIGSVFGAALLVAGIAQLVAGHLVGLALVGLVLLATAASVGLMGMRRRVTEPAVAELLDRVNEVLDSTAAFPGRPGGSGDSDSGDSDSGDSDSLAQRGPGPGGPP